MRYQLNHIREFRHGLTKLSVAARSPRGARSCDFVLQTSIRSNRTLLACMTRNPKRRPVMVVERGQEHDWFVDGRKYHERHNIDGWEHVELIYYTHLHSMLPKVR